MTTDGYCTTIILSLSSKIDISTWRTRDFLILRKNISRYGTEPSREKARLVRHALRGLARRAWAREQDIVSGAAPGEFRELLCFDLMAA